MPLDVDGPAAPPRRNGELAFEAPWESRLFGLTMALHEAGLLAWEDFRRRLIAEVGAADRGERPEPESPYWRCWQRALETLLAARDVCDADALARRTRLLASRSDHR